MYWSSMMQSNAFCFAVGLVLCGSADKLSGPFDVIIKEPVDCKETGSELIYYNETIIRKTGKRSHTLSLHAFLAVPLTKDVKGVLNFSVWGNGGWRPNYLTIQGFVCEIMKERIPGMFEEALRQAGNITDCPFPAGDYHWNEMDANPQVNLAQMVYNKYKIELSYYLDGELIGCTGLIADVVPKASKKG